MNIIELYSFKIKAGKQFCSLTTLLSLGWLRKALFVRHEIYKDNGY